ncbi:four-carbon acid sugar kinase family protein [Agathobacter sp.]|uniref:four-carbon acid sugar kinase family protein n=1 Tax=Agathobacter sp. TaxID=2021311 RepID=UPI003FD87E16
MAEKTISIDVFEKYNKPDETKLDELLKKEIENNDTKFVVLDDDPTGVQTVHDISVYTDWTVESMKKGFMDDNKVFYILTNSRGMTEAETTKIHHEIIDAVAQAAAETGKNYQFISRSDSTLRGHYPLETELLKEGVEKSGKTVDGEVLFPFFKEGGRFTIDNTHYVKYGDELVPAAQTEFAKDKTFGYTHSSIPEYVEEKTKGAYKAENVTCIALEDLRALNIDKITEQLTNVKDFNKVCVNAIDYCDVKAFCIAIYRAMAAGKSFMFRTAAGFVKVVGGVTDIPLLTRKEMVVKETDNGGVVVVGSHTAKTTAQLEELLKLENVVPVEFKSSLVLDGDEAFYNEVKRCVAEEEKIIASGKTAVCFTERKLLTVENDTKESALIRSVKISDGVQRLVGDLSITPAFVIAKGGITSSDVGTKALKVKCANVMGQIKPGIPVWQTGSESRFPQTPYVIFPGNVGEVTTLREAVEVLNVK